MQANKYVIKLIKEYDWLLLELEYKQDIFNHYDQLFKQAVSEYLKTDDDLKGQYQNYIESTLSSSKKSEWSEETIEYISDQKQLYREIAKRTHPDKNPDSDLMSKAAECYHKGDNIGLYLIATQLSIPFDISDNDIKEIEEKIELLKIQISFIEQHISWVWYFSSQEIKNQLVTQFIKKLLV
jgi:hypothetical protein